MTAVPCRFCGNPVAPSTKRCPACGGKWPYSATQLSAPLKVFLGFAIFFVVLWLGFCNG